MRKDLEDKIPVIGIPIVNGYEWLDRLIKSIDYPVKTVLILNNSGGNKDLTEKLTALEKQKFELIDNIQVVNFPSNMGVSFAWNFVIKSNILEPYWIISNHDIEFTPGLLKEMVKYQKGPQVSLVHPGHGNYTQGSFDLFLIKDKAVREIGLFDENLYPAYGEDADYIMRLKNNNSVRVCGLEDKVHKHGNSLAGDPLKETYIGSIDNYIASNDVDEINANENYDERYKGEGGRTKKEASGDIEERLTHINELNYTYLNEKWGEWWRGTAPHLHPMNNSSLPQSYTTFDIDFVREKHLGF